MWAFWAAVFFLYLFAGIVFVFVAAAAGERIVREKDVGNGVGEGTNVGLLLWLLLFFLTYLEKDSMALFMAVINTPTIKKSKLSY